MKNYVYFTFFLIVLLACGKENTPIPDVYVNFRIQASEVGGVGSAIYTSSSYGVRGIIIYHINSNEYLAFERTCSYRPSDACELVYLDNETNPTFLVDSCCNSRFLLEDGTPFDGPALLPLKQYATFFDGTYIQITN